jgi:hypothetical protein
MPGRRFFAGDVVLPEPLAAVHPDLREGDTARVTMNPAEGEGVRLALQARVTAAGSEAEVMAVLHLR